MAQLHPPQPPQQKLNTPAKKRKEPPSSNNASNNSSKKQKTDHRAKQRDARTLSTQTTSKAFANGALDVDAFVKAREFEMRALDSSMQRSKKALNRRAFQQVPKELRRRTASHNVKRIPKRLRERGKKEMIEDNTPTVTARRRKLTGHMRLRLETAKKLRALGAQRTAAKEKMKPELVTVIDPKDPQKPSSDQETSKPTIVPTVTTRKPKVKKASLAKPPILRAKFRKRQVHKSWLPTHLFHAKRAHMTPPSAPLWRFAMPLTPTQKSYRPTHRAILERGAVAWDTSYMATIGLEGEQRSIEGMLKGLGVGSKASDVDVWGVKGGKWRRGQRILESFAFEREAPHRLIAPITIVWCAPSSTEEAQSRPEEKRKRWLFLRVHPSAFYQLWEEMTRLAKVAKPSVNVEDLRFELGSIEITGPGSTEALHGALWPTKAIDLPESSHEYVWSGLAGVADPSTLPSGALLAFTIQDPRLHHPPRTIELPETQVDQTRLLELLSSWPCDQVGKTAEIFDRTGRLRGSKLASQKAINRRKSLANPGEYPTSIATDPDIPVLLYTNVSFGTIGKKSGRASWTVLTPWKAIQPIWYALMYYPLSTGQQPRFGGLREQQQLPFEAGRPWFPADYPGTKAGWDWEVMERRRRWDEWQRRPKSKRASWEKVDLGDGRRGEVGEGWSCDWALLLKDGCGREETSGNGETTERGVEATGHNSAKRDVAREPPQKPDVLTHIAPVEAAVLLKPDSSASAPRNFHGKLLTVRIILISRGVPQTCARIYRLPSAEKDSELRRAWLDLQPNSQCRRGQNRNKSKHSLPNLSGGVPPHIKQRRLAQSLLQPPRAGEDAYPACPGAEDLIGFVTSGNFNLAEGQGTGIGSLLLGKVIEDAQGKRPEGRLCIVRNGGADVGRLAKWDAA